MIKLIGVCSEPQFAIVLEFMINGSLEKLVFDRRLGLQSNLLIGIAQDVAAGVKKKSSSNKSPFLIPS